MLVSAAVVFCVSVFVTRYTNNINNASSSIPVEIGLCLFYNYVFSEIEIETEDTSLLAANDLRSFIESASFATNESAPTGSEVYTAFTNYYGLVYGTVTQTAITETLIDGFIAHTTPSLDGWASETFDNATQSLVASGSSRRDGARAGNKFSDFHDSGSFMVVAERYSALSELCAIKSELSETKSLVFIEKFSHFHHKIESLTTSNSTSMVDSDNSFKRAADYLEEAVRLRRSAKFSAFYATQFADKAAYFRKAHSFANEFTKNPQYQSATATFLQLPTQSQYGTELNVGALQFGDHSFLVHVGFVTMCTLACLYCLPEIIVEIHAAIAKGEFFHGGEERPSDAASTGSANPQTATVSGFGNSTAALVSKKSRVDPAAGPIPPKRKARGRPRAPEPIYIRSRTQDHGPIPAGSPDSVPEKAGDIRRLQQVYGTLEPGCYVQEEFEIFSACLELSETYREFSGVSYYSNDRLQALAAKYLKKQEFLEVSDYTERHCLKSRDWYNMMKSCW